MKKFTIYLFTGFLTLLSAKSFSQLCGTATVSAGADQTICAGTNVSLSGSMGSAITTVTWSAVGGGTFTPNANTLNATFIPSVAQLTLGSATLTLTSNDPAGPCLAASDQMVVTINASVTVNAGADQTICAGSNVALAAAITGGATAGLWSGGTGTFSPGANSLICAYTPSASETAAGTVTLTLTSDDPPGPCPAASDQVVISITSATVNAGADQVICAGSSVSLSGSAGNAVSSVTWSGGSGIFSPNPNTLNCVYMPSASEVASGSVSLTLSSDITACGTGSDQVMITINAAASVNASVDQTVCAGTAVSLSGSVGGSASAGTWSGGTGSFVPNANTLNCFYVPSASEIATGSVTLTLTTNDPPGPCPTVNDQLLVTINASVTVNAGVDQTVCEGSPVSLSGSVSGGISTGTWSGGSGTFSPNPNTLGCVYIPSASDIAAGTVTLTLTSDDPSGPCGPTNDQVVITISPLPTVSITANGSTSICQGSSVVLIASAGATYLWSTAAATQSISVSASGDYSVTVTDGNGCAASASVSVTVNALPTVSVSATATAICQGDVATLASSSCANYLWSNGATTQTISVNASGTYSVTVTDNNGCSASASIAITVHALPSVSISANGSTSICQGDSVELMAGVYSSYLWSTAAVTANIYASAAGNYSVTVTDSNGCSASASIAVTVNPLPSVSITANGSTTLCDGDSVELSAGAGNNYFWSTGEVTQNIYVNASGNYAVNVTDGNGCSDAAMISVTVNALPTVSVTASATVICQGDAAILTCSPGVSYLWSTSATTQTISVNTSGTYFVTLTDNNGCSAGASIAITVHALPNVTINVNGSASICQGDSVELMAGVFSSYLWSTAEISASIYVSVAGNYSVTVTDSNGCSAAASVAVVINALPTVSITAGGSTTICSGDSVELMASVGTSYLWSTAQVSQSIYVNAGGTYSVMVTDSNGCSNSANVSITVNGLPVVNLGADTTICPGQSLVLDAGNAGANFLWNTAATTQHISVSASGSFYVEVTDGSGCTNSDTIQVIIAAPVVVNLGNDTTAYVCTHNGIVLDAGISGATYLWNTTAVTQNINATVSGSYYVDVTVGGCSGSDTIAVTIIDNTIDLDLGPDTTVCNCIQLSAYTSGATYSWCGGQQYSTINVCATGVYCVEVNNGMCKAWDTISVVLAAPPTVNLGNDTILLNGSLALDAGNAGATFQWSTGATAQTITVTASGTYYVAVTNPAGCTATDTINIGFLNGVAEYVSKAYPVAVYPNPSEGGSFTLKFEMPEQGNFEIRLYNQTGAQVYLEKSDKFKGVYQKQLAVQHLAPGLYFAEVIRNGSRSTARLTVQ